MQNTLSLIALKCARNVFDLSSGLTHISIRDQVVRARLLVRDIRATRKAPQRILIVGAGVGGVSAAMAAGALGCKSLVIDTNDRPFALQRFVTTRHVGPFMYEWPASFSGDQSYPPVDTTLWPQPVGSTPTWTSSKPMQASTLATELDQWLSRELFAWPTSKPQPMFMWKVNPALTTAFVKAFAQKARAARTAGKSAWSDPAFAPVASFKPDYIILAAGAGSEQLSIPGLLPSAPFWKDDTILSVATTSRNLAVLGSGDGAMQDTLRAVTMFPHPLEFIDHLTSKSGTKRAFNAQLETLRNIEQQHRLMSAWTLSPDVNQAVDERCKAAAQSLAKHAVIRGRVGAALRRGAGGVTLVVRAGYFGKAYLLNRFVVHLIDACQAAAGGSFKGRMTLTILWNTEATSGSVSAGKTTLLLEDTVLATSRTLTVDDVLVRFGIDKHTIPGRQMIGLSSAKKAHRTALAQVPMPFVVGEA